MVKLNFKFNLLCARILRIGVGVLVGDALLLQVLILNFDSHKELYATLVFLLVAGDEGRLLARRVDVTGSRLACLWLSFRVIGRLLRGGAGTSIDLCISLIKLFTAAAAYFALFIRVG